MALSASLLDNAEVQLHRCLAGAAAAPERLTGLISTWLREYNAGRNEDMEVRAVPVCASCGRFRREHQLTKCLFAPGRYRPGRQLAKAGSAPEVELTLSPRL